MLLVYPARLMHLQKPITAVVLTPVKLRDGR
jgi:hypothetical protein